MSMHRLDDEHTIVQVVAFGREATSAQYILLRVRNSTMRAYSIEIEKLNRAYLEELTAAGLVRDTTPELLRKTGLRHWKIVSKEGLLRVMTDVSKLTEEQLTRSGRSASVAPVSADEWAKHVVEERSRHARYKLEDGAPSVNFTSGKANGCPAVLPPKVLCRQYAQTPPDPHPLMKHEVIHFDKYGCGHCRNIERYVAAWQLANQDITYFSSSVIDWSELEVNLYDADRVPSFAINRKYLVSLDTSDPQLVEYALNLVTALAKEK